MPEDKEEILTFDDPDPDDELESVPSLVSPDQVSQTPDGLPLPDVRIDTANE